MKKNILPFNWKEVPNVIPVEYTLNDDFILLDNPAVSSTFKHPFITAIISTKGEVRMSVGLKQYHSKASVMFVVMANQILQYDYLSDDFEGYCIMMSQRFADSLILSAKERLPIFLDVSDNPCIPLNEQEVEAMVMYYNMLKRALSNHENPHNMEVARHLTLAFFYSAVFHFHNIQAKEEKSRQELLAEKFLADVNQNYKMHRELEFYASRQSLTPKYLSRVIKELTGSTANEWIDNYVTREAKALLKSTNMTIQQISDALNFPSQSFFGKYFKRIIGVSPKEYRK